MQFYTGYEYLLIDAASQFGFDKLTFEERIKWSQDNDSQLEALASQAETKPLYLKAVMAIRKAQQGKPTGHLVGVDACCSGIQIMSALTGCEAGANSTGLIDPNVRADAYTACTKEMNNILGGGLVVSRADAKAALMTTMYGSKMKPKEIFGFDTPELKAFYQAAATVAPGAWELLQDLLASWQAYSLVHEWKLPDGYDARVKVMKKVETRIEVDELDHATFTYEFYENQGTKTGLSNAANVIHSVDAYVLRSMHRRCNYDRELAEQVACWIEIEMIERYMGGYREVAIPTGMVGYYVEQYNRSSLADITIMSYLNQENLQQLSKQHLDGLASIINGMLQYQPFELVSVHDEFRAHANNVNWVRWQYKEILAEIADSNLLDDLLSQIHGRQGNFNKLSTTLGTKIRSSAYGLCQASSRTLGEGGMQECGLTRKGKFTSFWTSIEVL